MTMTTKPETLMLMATTAALAMGCAANGSASLGDSQYPKAYASASVADDADASHDATTQTDAQAASTPLTDDLDYIYAYDYDNDGSYAKAHIWADGDHNDDKMRKNTKYAYQYDRDGDGSHARERTPIETVTTQELDPDDMEVAAVVIPFEIDPSLEMACKEAKPTFFFEYDSAKLPEQADSDFDNIVECLQHTSLKDSDIEVIGHADARGPEGYNKDLGHDRAQTVATELRDAGLSGERIEVVSRGEAKADEPTHWDDRRVVIRMQ